MGYVERDAYAAATLVARMEDQTLDTAPVWDDVATFDGTPWRGAVDLVSAGYPCQPFSDAGHRRGAADPRHLWPHIARIVDEVRPEWCFFENVAGHLSLGYREVHDDLGRMGYTAAAGLFSAEEMGAPHRRIRLFIVSHTSRVGLEGPQPGRAHPDSDSDRRERLKASDGGPVAVERDVDGLRVDVPDADGDLVRPQQGRSQPGRPGTSVAGDDGTQKPLAHPESVGVGTGLCEAHQPRTGSVRAFAADDGGSRREWWAVEPDVGRVADGVAARVDRLRCIGNGVVPAVAAAAWAELSHAATDPRSDDLGLEVMA